MNKEFEIFALNEYKNSSFDILSFYYEDKKYWLKKARATKSSLSHKIYYKLFKLELIAPVEEKSAKEALVFETNKLIKFKSLGIDVPSIIFKNEEFFVLEDSGKNINSYIRKRDAEEEDINFYIKESINAITNIHIKNEYHGGAQARNLTYKNQKVYAIDLEDSFDERNIDLKTLQFRDFLLFLLSLTKIRAKVEIDYENLINKYIEQTGNCDFKKRLNKLAKKIYFFIKLSKVSFIRKRLGNDVILFFKLFDILYNLKDDN